MADKLQATSNDDEKHLNVSQQLVILVQYHQH